MVREKYTLSCTQSCTCYRFAATHWREAVFCQVGPAILQELCLGIRTVFILTLSLTVISCVVNINDIVYIFTAIVAV